MKLGVQVLGCLRECKENPDNSEKLKSQEVLPVRDQADIVSILETVEVETGKRTVLKEFDGVVIEAPNWLKTKPAILFNSRGRIQEYHLETGEVRTIDTGHCIYCNNDHVLSPDHK